MKQLFTFFLLTLLTAQGAFATPYYQVATEDVATAVGSALVARGAGESITAKVYTDKQALYQAESPLTVAVQALTFDKKSLRWQANMHVLSGGKTVSTMPISGRYEPMVSVPMLNREVKPDDIISDADITWKSVTERHLRKDTVRAPEDLIGKSPKRYISAERAIRMTEVNQPIILKKGSAVQVTYSSPYMSIRTTGLAMESGSKGSLVRVRNLESKQIFSARVTGASDVEANLQKSL
jgi:flagella basal body P-ring formation protein FlgA